jgi:hypothetical protein
MLSVDTRFQQDLGNALPSEFWNAKNEESARQMAAVCHEQAKLFDEAQSSHRAKLRAFVWVALVCSFIQSFAGGIILISETGDEWKLGGASAQKWPQYTFGTIVLVLGLLGVVMGSLALCTPALANSQEDYAAHRQWQDLAKFVNTQLSRPVSRRAPVADFFQYIVETSQALKNIAVPVDSQAPSFAPPEAESPAPQVIIVKQQAPQQAPQ